MLKIAIPINPCCCERYFFALKTPSRLGSWTQSRKTDSMAWHYYIYLEILMWTETTFSSGLMHPSTGELCCNVFVLHVFCATFCAVFLRFCNGKLQALLRSINYSPAQSTALNQLMKRIPLNAVSRASTRVILHSTPCSVLCSPC